MGDTLEIGFSLITLLEASKITKSVFSLQEGKIKKKKV